LTTVAERLKPEKLFDQFLEYRESLGMEVLPLGDSDVMRNLVGRLRGGGLVALLGDRDITRNGVEVDFFGACASFPAGPATLAILTGAPLFPVTMHYEGPRTIAVVQDRIEVPEHLLKSEWVAHMTQQIARAYEGGISQHPEDWHMLQKNLGHGPETTVTVKRIGIVCPYSWDVPGGVRSHIADLALTLQGRGYEVSVLAPVEDPDTLPDYVFDGGRPIAVSYNGAVARMSFGVRATRRVRQWIREGDFDVVHIHEPVAPSSSLLTCWAARGTAGGNLALFTRTLASALRRLLRGPNRDGKIRGRIAVSEAARETLVRHIGGDAVLIPNGVRVSDFRDQESVTREGTQRICSWGG